MTTLRNEIPRNVPLFPTPPNYDWVLSGSWELVDGSCLVADLIKNKQTDLYCLWDGLSFISAGAKLLAVVTAEKTEI